MQVLGNHFRVVRFLLFSFVNALVFCWPMFGRTSDIRLSILVGHMGTWALSRWALGTWALGTWALGTWALDTWVHGHNGTGHMGNGHLGSCLAKKGLCLSLADFLQWHIRCGKPVRTSTNTDCNWPTHNKKTPKTLQIFLTKDCDFGGSNEEEEGVLARVWRLFTSMPFCLGLSELPTSTFPGSTDVFHEVILSWSTPKVEVSSCVVSKIRPD